MQIIIMSSCGYKFGSNNLFHNFGIQGNGDWGTPYKVKARGTPYEVLSP